MPSKILKGMLAAVFFSAVGACGTATAPVPVSPPMPKSDSSNGITSKQMENIIGAVGEVMREDYIDPARSGNTDELTVTALKAIVSSLDPHSTYMTKKDFDDMMDDVNQVYGGIGIEYDDKDNNLIIANIKDDTPSQKAGLKPDDMIIRIDDKPVSIDAKKGTTPRISGEAGTTVKLTVKRPGITEPLEFSIVREVIKTPATRTASIGNDIAYIRLSNFMQDDLTAEFEKAVKTINTKMGSTLSSYIIDLRDNLGGHLNDAVNIAADLLNTDKTIVSTRGRKPRDNEDRNGTQDHTIVDLTHGKKIVVLVNQYSASASEVLTGALQDLAPHRVTVIGTTTFGKGLVQTLLPLRSPPIAGIFKRYGVLPGDIPDGIIKLTTAHYFTPSGRSIHNNGITPDILFVNNVSNKTEEPETEQRREATLPRGLARPGDAKPDETKTSQSCTPQLDVKVRDGYDRILRTKDGYVQQEILCAEDFLRGTQKWTTIAPYIPPAVKGQSPSP